MDQEYFKIPLYLPAQGAAETDATIIEWYVTEGARFHKGDVLAQVDSAKSVFDFEAPCDGLVLRIFHLEGETIALSEAVLEIETSDAAMKDWIPPAASREETAIKHEMRPAIPENDGESIVILGVGGYLPPRVVYNAELVADFPEISEQYVYQVTGIRQRHWAGRGRKTLEHGLQGGPGSDPQIGYRHQGNRRDHCRHDHPRRGHAVDRLHPAGPPLAAFDPGLRSQCRLFRMALRRLDGSGDDPQPTGSQRVDRRRRHAIAALGPLGP